MSAVVTCGSLVFGSYVNRFCQNGDTADRQPAPWITHRRDRVAKSNLAARQIHRRQKNTVRELRKLLLAAADTDITLNLLVIRNEVFVTERPVLSITVVALCFEVKIG